MRRLLPFTALLAFGCTVGPDYVPPEPDVPETWAEAEPDAAPAADFDLATWWEQLEDPALTRLVERSITANPDLARAFASITAVRASRGVVASELWPVVNADGSYTRRYFGSAAFGFRPGGGSSTSFDQFQAGLNASWELDLFGRVRRGIEAADADIGASVEDYRAVLVSLTAEVARTYLQARSFERRLEIARNAVEAQEATLELAEARRDAGLAPDLDVARAGADLEATRARIPTLEQGLREALHRLAVLGGDPPESAELRGLPDGDLPAAPPPVVTTLPADVLLRRPDVRRAERELAARTARIGVAAADRYPRVVLAGSIGITSTELETFDGRAGFWSVGPSVAWNLFDAGAIASNVAAAEALRDAARSAFHGVVLRALEEVENALGGYAREQRRAAALADAATLATEAKQQAETLYAEGLSDFDAVLDAERRRLELEDELAQSRAAVLLRLVDLYRALGGGWNDALPEAE